MQKVFSCSIYLYLGLISLRGRLASSISRHLEDARHNEIKISRVLIRKQYEKSSDTIVAILAFLSDTQRSLRSPELNFATKWCCVRAVFFLHYIVSSEAHSRGGLRSIGIRFDVTFPGFVCLHRNNVISSSRKPVIIINRAKESTGCIIPYAWIAIYVRICLAKQSIMSIFISKIFEYIYLLSWNAIHVKNFFMKKIEEICIKYETVKSHLFRSITFK